MEIQTLKAEVRETRGKGPARQLRIKGLIPAVFYGPGKTPLNLSLAPASLARCMTTPWGRNQLIELDIAGTKELALVRDIDTNPLTSELRHADFYAVSKDRPVAVRVPFEAKGRAVGVQQGGVLHVIYRSLPILAPADKVPAKIEVDVSNLNINQSIKVKDLVLSEGVKVDLPQERPVVAVETKQKEVVEEDAAAVPGAPAAGAAAAAPAAAAAKDAKAAAPAKDTKKK